MGRLLFNFIRPWSDAARGVFGLYVFDLRIISKVTVRCCRSDLILEVFGTLPRQRSAEEAVLPVVDPAGGKFWRGFT
jgi:hypothetical protein